MWDLETAEVRVPWFAKPFISKHRLQPLVAEKAKRLDEDMLPPYLPRGWSAIILLFTQLSNFLIFFPDPRSWTRDDVCLWVTWTLFSHNLPCPSVDRFLMNGKAVCLMSVYMFTARVPIGGKMLYRDFQIRLAEAMTQ